MDHLIEIALDDPVVYDKAKALINHIKISKGVRSSEDYERKLFALPTKSVAGIICLIIEGVKVSRVSKHYKKK